MCVCAHLHLEILLAPDIFTDVSSPLTARSVTVRLLVSQLRRSAFDRGSVLGREFFLTKGALPQVGIDPKRNCLFWPVYAHMSRTGKQDVWEVFRREKQLGTGSFGTAYKATALQFRDLYGTLPSGKPRA